MAIVQWSAALSVGDVALDNQHRQLFELVNQLHEGMAKGQANELLDGILDRLIRYTAGHFADEERRMQQVKYPQLIAHKLEHDLLTKRVLEFQRDFRAGKIALSVHVMSFLKDWLQRHIKQSDRSYAPFLTNTSPTPH